MLMDRQTDNERTELHQFQKQLSYDGDLSPIKFELDWTKHFQSPATKMLTARQMDVRHINLIGRLVTRDQPKNSIRDTRTPQAGK